jgi:hypothetical protein
VVVAERPVGEQGDLGGEQAGGGALELGHAGQVAVAVDAAAEPAGWGECQVCDAPCVPASRTRWAARGRTCWSVAGGRCGGSASGWLTVPVYRPAAIPVGAIVVRVGGSARRVA